MKTYKEFTEAKIVGHINLPKQDDKVTKADLNSLEKVLDVMFKRFGIDIEFTRHFLDRVNDPRNKENITIAELQQLYNDTYTKYAKHFTSLDDKTEAVLFDIQTDINIPFVLSWNKKKKMIELVAKTTMRKKNFKTRNTKYKV